MSEIVKIANLTESSTSDSSIYGFIIDLDKKHFKFNEKYNRYDHINQYPLINLKCEIEVETNISSCAETNISSCAETNISSCAETNISSCAETEIKNDNLRPKRLPSLTTTISPIDKVSKKKTRQLSNMATIKNSVDTELLNFKYANPYGFINLYNPKYSNFKIKEEFDYKEDNNIKESNSTKFIINDRQSKYSGFIIDITTNRPLSVPPPPLLKKLNKRAINLVNDFLEQKLYEIIKIEDGTIITLYSWIHPINGVMWSMASNNGYDVSSYKWMGKLTYAEIFYDLINRLYPEFKELTGMDILYIAHKTEIKTLLTFTNLDTKYCYSMGFRHHNFHPMKIDPEKVWQVQYVDLSEKNPKIYYGGKFSSTILPIQEVWEYSKFFKDSSQNITYSTIEKKGASSFINACIESGKHVEDSIYFKQEENIEISNTSLFIPQNGFIFRSLNLEKTGELSNFIIEYPLFKINKKLIYMQYTRDKYINEKNRMVFNAMRAFLNDGRGDLYTSAKKKFISLYPEWSSKFYEFEQFINYLEEQITNNIIGNNIIENNIIENKKIAFGKLNINNTAFYKIVTDFSIMIKKAYRIKKVNNINNLKTIINNYICNSEYAIIYLHLFNI